MANRDPCLTATEGGRVDAGYGGSPHGGSTPMPPP